LRESVFNAKDQRVEGSKGDKSSIRVIFLDPSPLWFFALKTRFLECAQEGDQIGLLLLAQLQLLDQIEELHHIFERQHPSVVQIRRRLFYAAQREGLE
jgi:hypothetical protein